MGEDGPAETFIDLIDYKPKLAMKKKYAYIKRAKEIENLNEQKTYLLRYTPNSLSYWILWHCRNCH